MAKRTIGWDIGGAHLKAVLLDTDGSIESVLQVPCPLWKGIGYLYGALAETVCALGAHSGCHVLTMTGELADCFTDRREGVRAIIQAAVAELRGNDLLVYAGQNGFLKVENVNEADYAAIASANWLASVEFAAKKCRTALFVDVGSTTTDILVIEDFQSRVQGYSDYERLVSGELLYTGIVRTAVMSIAQRAEFKGREMGLMTEYFANMADVYRLTGDLPEAYDQAETADGREKTVQASARRLSRLTGYEYADVDLDNWLEFARYLKERQKTAIRQACLQQLVRFRNSSGLHLVGAGVGRFLLKEIASDWGVSYLDFTEFCVTRAGLADFDAATCAPAVAVARLGGGFG